MTQSLAAFGPDLFLSEGPVVRGAGGFRFPTRMAVARMPDCGLWVWSPVALTPELRAAVDALGPVRHVVAPNGLHHLFVGEWASAYPEARVYAAPDVAGKHPDLGPVRPLSDDVPGAWRAVFDMALVRGNRLTTEAVFLHRPSRTVLVCDLMQNIPRDFYRGWRKVIARLDRMTEPEPAMPAKFRVGFVDRAAARPAAARILSWPAERLVVAHGTPVDRDPAPLLERAFGALARGGRGEPHASDPG
ncbi:protein of unknown function [Roseivivax marinus]|jgi:hypothetical protein|uniref:DUF4336 domain-containing protein n=1 Tax=Roseivivax marinus TaxID=1379903 RepID=UPI0008C611CA|nr:DUF4336 domain-containing protein [Roseivivax marinus]SEK56187.1 protein of unknown function [Roseivivax marinus]